MCEWCVNQHTKTGLVKEVLESKLTLSQVEIQVLDLVKKYLPEKKGILCGSSIHFDKEYLRKYMPELFQYLGYRLIDVTTISELVKRWYPVDPVEKKVKDDTDTDTDTHRALYDIMESIRKLKGFRETYFLK